MEPYSQEYNSWDNLVKKTIVVEAKARLQLSYYSHDMDNRFFKGNFSSHTILLKPQANCDKSSEKTLALQTQKRLTQLLSSSSRSDSSKTLEKKVWKEKKKKYYHECKKDLGILETNINADDITSGTLKDVSLITYFHCNRMGYYCLKPKRNSSKTPKS